MTALLELFAAVVGRLIEERATDAPQVAIDRLRDAWGALEDARRDPARIPDSMARLGHYAPDRAAGLRAAQDELARRFPDPK